MAVFLKRNVRLAHRVLAHRTRLHDHFVSFPDWQVAPASGRCFVNDARRDGVDGSLSDSLRQSLRNIWRSRDQEHRNKQSAEALNSSDEDITDHSKLIPQIIRKLEFAERVRKDQNMDALTEHLRSFGHALRVRSSDIPGAGRGVCLAMGSFERGQVLTMYPGTVYTITRLLEIATLESVNEGIMDAPSGPRLPVFMHKNRYLLQEREVHDSRGDKIRVDLLADGNPFGKSALRFLQEVEDEAADSSWLELQTESPPPRDNYKKHRTDLLLNNKGVGKSTTAEHTQPLQFGMLGNRSALALGHLINHCPPKQLPHVRFVFVPISPNDAPPALLGHLPNVNARPDRAQRWAIAVVAVRAPERQVDDPNRPLEIFSDYGREPHDFGWQVRTSL